MTQTAHALVAAAFATKVQEPVLLAALSFSSHLIMDSVPHWDFGTNWRKRSKTATALLSLADTVMAITLAYFLFREKVGLFLFAVALFFSFLPDWIQTVWYIFFAKQDKSGLSKNPSPIEFTSYYLFRFTHLFHTKAPFPWGVITTILTVLFFWALVL